MSELIVHNTNREEFSLVLKAINYPNIKVEFTIINKTGPETIKISIGNSDEYIRFNSILLNDFIDLLNKTRDIIVSRK